VDLFIRLLRGNQSERSNDNYNDYREALHWKEKLINGNLGRIPKYYIYIYYNATKYLTLSQFQSPSWYGER
jgi:hypothetical protein